MRGKVLAVLAAMIGMGAGPASRPLATDEVRRSMASPTAALRLRTVDALDKAAVKDSWATDVLISALADSDIQVRIHAATALGRRRDVNGVPALTHLTTSKNERRPVRQAADAALKAIGPLTAEQKAWAEQANRFALVGDRVIKLPDADYSFPSSLKLTLEQSKADLRKAGSSQADNP